MNKEQLNFAETIAWLHDIGRFEQFHKYGTFADTESENHSEIALRVIEELKLLEEFEIVQKEIIFQSILNHNIPEVPENIKPETDFYSRLLRDADKLDIWRVAIEQNIFHTLHDERMPDRYDIPDKLMQSFRNNKVINLNQVHSFYDSILFRISWIYDLNFQNSFRSVMDRNIVHRLLDKLPDFTEKEEIIEHTGAWMQKRTGHTSNIN